MLVPSVPSFGCPHPHPAQDPRGKVLFPGYPNLGAPTLTLPEHPHGKVLVPWVLSFGCPPPLVSLQRVSSPPGKSKAAATSPGAVPSAGPSGPPPAQQPLAPLAVQAAPQVTTPRPRRGGHGGAGEASARCSKPQGRDGRWRRGVRVVRPEPRRRPSRRPRQAPRCCQRRVGRFARGKAGGLPPNPPSLRRERGPRAGRPAAERGGTRGRRLLRAP